MITHQTFGAAIEALKNGKAIARAGWNGKGMCVYLNRGAVDVDVRDKCCEPPAAIEGIRGDLFDDHIPGIITRLPNLNMKSASGSTVTGWLASQTDILAEDWCVLD